MVSFVLVTRILGSDRADILPGGVYYAGAVTALSGTHFTTYVPSVPVPSVRVGCREVFVLSYLHEAYLDYGGVHFLTVSPPLSARWWHVASFPLPSAQACPKKIEGTPTK